MNVLVKTKSAEDIQGVCEVAFLYRELKAVSYPETAVADIAKKFSCTKGETRQIVSDAIMVMSDVDSSQTPDSVFPENFPSKLKKSCQDYFKSRFPEWRQSIMNTKVAYPKLLDVQCVPQTNQDQMTPTCLLQLKVDNGQTDSSSAESEESYKIQLTKDNITMMLNGLNKIKDQLSSVAQ